ncbi:hypothetical protein [Brevibacillus choshinensis]|uniref:hypothetical protein n=1 Tax=Brevibacillus choshinensis TaxID=54911 RepID=UPI002E1AD2C1|nr:hypothetical protein [Brevibacillus choshinensis]
MSDLKLIEAYKNNLQNYSVEQLRHITEQGVWSLGQMYSHLILVALEYLDNVENCAKACEEQSLGKTNAGERLYKLGAFPSPLESAEGIGTKTWVISWVLPWLRRGFPPTLDKNATCHYMIAKKPTQESWLFRYRRFTGKGPTKMQSWTAGLL